MSLRRSFLKKSRKRLLVDRLYHTEKYSDGILYVLRTGCQWKMLPKEYGSGSTCHRRFQEWNKLDIFRMTWIKLLKIYDEKVDINWTWPQSLDSISIKSPLGGPRLEIIPSQIGVSLGTKRHILTDKKGIPLSAVIYHPPASTHDIKLVTDVVDNTVIKRPRSSTSKSRRGTKRRRLIQHLCLDKGYNSAEEEQKLIKRGYVLHIYQSRTRRKRRKEKIVKK